MTLSPANTDSFLEYPGTRPFTIPRLTPFIIAAGIIYITFITLFAIVTVGYEYVAISSVSYNLTLSIWYDFLPQTSWTPVSRTCQGSVIKVGEGTIYLTEPADCLGLTPDNIIKYQLEGFLDPDKISLME
jgi:hypothetical protein